MNKTITLNNGYRIKVLNDRATATRDFKFANASETLFEAGKRIIALEDFVKQVATRKSDETNETLEKAKRLLTYAQVEVEFGITKDNTEEMDDYQKGYDVGYDDAWIAAFRDFEAKLSHLVGE